MLSLFSVFAGKEYRSMGLWEGDGEGREHPEPGVWCPCMPQQGEGPLSRNSLPENVGIGPLSIP